MSRFIQVLQKDIVTKPEEWKYAGPGKFITLSDRAKNVYCVLSVIAYSAAGNAKDMVVQGGRKLGSSWFWTSHALLQQLTGACQKTVQRGIKELQEEGFVDYFPAKKQGQRCFFKIKRIQYKQYQDFVPDRQVKPKTEEGGKQKLPSETPLRKSDSSQKDIPQGKPDKIEMLSEKKEILFQKGRDTHDEDGFPINKAGKRVNQELLSPG